MRQRRSLVGYMAPSSCDSRLCGLFRVSAPKSRWTFCPFCVESRDFLTKPGPAIGGAKRFGVRPRAFKGWWGLAACGCSPSMSAGRIWGNRTRVLGRSIRAVGGGLPFRFGFVRVTGSRALFPNDQRLRGENMLKMTRLAALAAVLIVAASAAIVPQAVQAQAQPAAPAAASAQPATPAA